VITARPETITARRIWRLVAIRRFTGIVIKIKEKWQDLKERTLRNRRDKRFWTLLFTEWKAHPEKKMRGYATPRRKYGGTEYEE